MCPVHSSRRVDPAAGPIARQSAPRTIGRADLALATGLAILLFLIYNANGREIGSYDSQPNKFAARELLLRSTLTLNHVVGATPEFAKRDAFVLAADGRYRSAYSPVPSVLAAAIAWPLWKTGVLDIRAPFGPNRIAVIAASSLTALSVSLAFITARRWVSRRSALAVAAALGLGTGYWYAVSQTLWEHETAVFGLSLALVAFANPRSEFSMGQAVWTGIGLALAGLARPQLSPLIAVVLAGTYARGGVRRAAIATGITAAAAVTLMWLFLKWFGSPLGPLPLVERMGRATHQTHGAFSLTLESAAGLLISPSRGLFVFSPVVLVAVAGVKAAMATSWRAPLRWCALAALSQYLVYASFSVWWGGHTYGPRYMLDVLPVLVPLAAAAVARMHMRPIVVCALAVMTVWSITVAATGAFCYPHDAWNVTPTDVDRDHARLWSWTDPQVLRCWRRGPSPQNFNLFEGDTH